MVNVQIKYNPYVVKTQIFINGKEIEEQSSPLAYVNNKRLQEWIEPKWKWEGIFKALRESTGEDQIRMEFIGTFGDFADLSYAKDKFGQCFNKIELVHKNKENARELDPYQKMLSLKELYEELQAGPIEEFKTVDIQNAFENAINSEFRIVIVAPMSSGKSTLINAIIGRDMLPAVNQATTAVITEIKANDNLPEFWVNATDKYGQVVVENKKATRELISELNYKKDPKDPDGKAALIRKIQIEGPIPNIPSNVLNTVFVDTPGGNNVQNKEHEEIMDEAINDENKSLILCVLNGENLGSYDGDRIMQKIANAMQNSTNGKLSRDRFLFVANKMDSYNVEGEPFGEAIDNNILPELEKIGITEPNLFLASAKTAALIRMKQHGEELSKKENIDLNAYIELLNDPAYMLTKYSSLNSSLKDKLISETEEYAKKEGDRSSRVAEINSGIPAIEMAIQEYLQKYAMSIKIKTAHDAFMQKVIERNMVEKCKEEWAQSKETFEALKNELQEKKEQCNHNEKLQEFRTEVDKIKINRKVVKVKQAEVVKQMDQLVENADDKIKFENAEHWVKGFSDTLKKIGEEAQVTLGNSIDKEIKNHCQEIIEKYAKYIRELDADGFFNIGNFDVKKTEKFALFNMNRAEDIVREEKYVKSESVKTGTRTVKKSGFLAGLARVFGVGGYETVNDFENQKFFMLKKFVKDQVTEVQHAFDKEINAAIKESEMDVEELKEITMSKLEGLDEMVSNLLNEIDQMLVSQEELRNKVQENEKKTKWLEEFVGKVDNLLAV